MLFALTLTLASASPAPPPALPLQPQQPTARVSRQRPSDRPPPQAAPRSLEEWRDLQDLMAARANGPGGVALFTGTPTEFNETVVTIAPTTQAGIHQVTFNGTGTGWQEKFLIGVPTAPLSPAPLLVMWHAYGVTEQDCMKNTGLMKRAMLRGWYVVAPRGAHDLNFAIDYAQENIAYVLDWVLATLSIDPTRIYGLGFSMGGGGALGFAARHLDPAGPLFAALVNHTGTVSVANAHANSTPAGKAILENPLLFGGTPAQEPFRYSRASVIDLDADGSTIGPMTDLARNLMHVPTSTWTASQDPILYLLDQSAALVGWLAGLGAAPVSVTVPSSLHSWQTLDEPAVLDWLEARSLSIPRTGTHRLLADRDGRWLHFTVHQDAPGSFTPFRWNFDQNLKRLTLDQSRNLERLVVDSSSLGINTGQLVRVVIGILDGTSNQIALDGYPSAPSQVLRAGQPTVAWSHDAGTQTLTLFENDGAAYPEWRIFP